jgi:hypothetical protein
LCPLLCTQIPLVKAKAMAAARPLLLTETSSVIKSAVVQAKAAAVAEDRVQPR